MEKRSFPYRHIIWDWNGTLLDDKWLCIESINTLLYARSLTSINEDKYDRIFRFPVKEYYRDAGFDFLQEPFEIPAMEFIRIYDRRKKECLLHKGATDILESFSQMGISQYLLSASETGMLNEMTNHFGITGYFKEVKGLDNHYAHGKSDLGKELMSSINASADSVVMIGDTCHDKEVADSLGVAAILCTHGHFPENRLIGCGSVLINSLNDLNYMISGV